MRLSYPQELPISAHREEIVNAIAHNQVVIIAGETGSGKTTQLPKMCLELAQQLGLENKFQIGCTQPRRIAATSVAGRVAEELAQDGITADLVGYKIRFQDQTSGKTRIKFMTDGVLLAETRQDRQLRRYNFIIVDEAHERSLNIDFLLGFLTQLLPRRPDLRVIITSATIDTEAFSKHFNKAPVIAVSGRTYPVSIQYHPLAEENQEGGKEEKENLLEHCVKTIRTIVETDPLGDILTFLPTEQDILECCEMLIKQLPEATVLPLFGRLPSGEQRKIFQPSRSVKIVVATNVAETSITVPGIRYVVDSGLARISQYNVRAKTTSLPVVRISQASCNQRSGRCGRVGPGVCFRLFSEDDYISRNEYTVPELKRSNLAEVILQMISLKIGHAETFPFIDPPHSGAIREGYRLLQELGALDSRRGLTQRGKLMAELPIDPCIARVIIEASENSCLKEITIISSVLAIQDPRIRPPGEEKKADTAHETFRHPHSDFMVLLNIWNRFHEESGSRSWSQLKKFSKQHYLSFQRMREWFDLHDQLERIISRREELTGNSQPGSYEQIHKALLAGFVRNVAMKKQGKIYQGANNKELMIFPGSHQYLQGGQWLVAAEFMETSRLYGLTVATIEPEWIEIVAPHLCSYSWSNPRWQKRGGHVVADETVAIFGLILCRARTVRFASRTHKNVSTAREIFIQAALVEGEITGNYDFLNANQALITHWKGTENKLRVRNVVADDQTIFNFYAARLPDHVCDQKSLNRFLKKGDNRQELVMKDGDILLRQPQEREFVDYPPSIQLRGIDIALEYNFDPGTEKDGVTYHLPYHFASGVSLEHFDWLIPGLLREKLTFLLKALPKSLRKKLVPINETVDRLLDEMDHGKGSFYGSLETAILKHFRMLIKRSDWPAELPMHLTPRFSLFDDAGKELCHGRDLPRLIRQSDAGSKGKQHAENTTGTATAPNALSSDAQQIIRRWLDSEHKEWDFAGLPPLLPLQTATGYSAGFLFTTLVAEKDKACVQVKFLRERDEAAQLNQRGNRFLCCLQFTQHLKALRKMCKTALSGPSAMVLLQATGGKQQAGEQLLEFLLKEITGPMPEEPLSQKEYTDTVAMLTRANLYEEGHKRCETLMSLLRKRREAAEKIQTVFREGFKKKLFLPPKQKAFQEHLDEILPGDLLTRTDLPDLEDMDRLLQCLLIRVERFYANPAKDQQKEELLQPHLRNLEKITTAMNTSLSGQPETIQTPHTEVLRYRNLVNEYRISLFAPELKTREPISPKKLADQWARTQALF